MGHEVNQGLAPGFLLLKTVVTQDTSTVLCPPGYYPAGKPSVKTHEVFLWPYFMELHVPTFLQPLSVLLGAIMSQCLMGSGFGNFLRPQPH